uniref:Osteomodulin n=1 Tax=Leptobrachium leishanense TaxID=445787 RepID=A0A8C5QZK9_9ANUR
MEILIKCSFIALLWLSQALCQYHEYDYDTDYGPDREEENTPQFPHQVDYGLPYFPHSSDCARECLCTPAYPLTMHCDTRKLKAIPQIPSRINQLHLQHNEIEAVSAKAFINATGLTELHLSHNKLRSNKIEIGAFAKINHLQQLYLQHNDLEEIPSPLPSSLERLFLGSNKINKLRDQDLQGLVNLTMLDLCNNQIDVIKAKTLTKLKNLMQLNICNNKLHSMPIKLPASLMYLSLENNSITDIPQDYFSQLLNLTAIRLSHNKFEMVHRRIFDLPKLMELNLGHNKLHQAFYIPKALEHLYLQDNEFENLNITFMCPTMDPMNTNRLTYLRVDQNKLKGPISTFAFLCFPHLQSIYYGEQKRGSSDSPYIQGPVIPQFPMMEEDEDDDDRDDEPQYHGGYHPQYHAHEHEESDNDFEDYSY